ncbi:aminotransferase-like domain-containing protein [Streptomyces sp. NPDC002851]
MADDEFHDFRRIADAIAADIARGRLRPGDRLPTQRAFARRRRIAPSTASRVYGELVRRGLVVGEVGRGTFVRAAGAPEPSGRTLTEPGTAAEVNLELNYPSVPGQSELLAAGLGGLLRPDVLAAATATAGPSGTPAARTAAARLLAEGPWRPAPEQVLFAGNARQAIAGALSTAVRPGGRVGVEALTYPVVKDIARRLGVTLVPIPSDEAGLRPEALVDAHRKAPLSAVYVQPTLHNPTCVTMPGERRAELAEAVRALHLPVIEDRIWAFLYGYRDGYGVGVGDGGGGDGGGGDGGGGPVPPLAAYARERTYVADGLSKRLAPGLSVGLLVVPEGRTGPAEAALRSGGWPAQRFALEAVTRWLGDGTVDRLVAAKRADAEARHRIAAACLAGQDVRTDPRAYYAWWRLPAPWRAETFTAAAASHGIAVTPGTAFAVSAHSAPHAIRVGLASPDHGTLRRALTRLAHLARHADGAERNPPGSRPVSKERGR